MNELLSSGVELMLIGMFIVYAFLAMLVLAIHLMSSFVQRFFPEIPGSHGAIGQQVSDPGIIAAITAAVHEYRKKHPRHDA
jgi:oxaloacetate decarboxylase (Na+ extruding) subunit gamma